MTNIESLREIERVLSPIKDIDWMGKWRIQQALNMVEKLIQGKNNKLIGVYCWPHDPNNPNAHENAKPVIPDHENWINKD